MRVYLWSGLLAITAILVACGGGESDLDRGLKDLKKSDLDTLVLPLDELGKLGKGLALDADGGFQDNDEAAEDSIDPDDSGDDLEEAGRISGFSVNYVNEEAQDEGDLFMITSTVVLFDSKDNASAALKKQIQDFIDAEGEDRDGVAVDDVETFDAKVGDEAKGITFTAEAPGIGTMRGTAILGRVGRLGFTTGLVTVGDDSWEKDAEELAKKHAEYITGVLTGEIDAEPIELPDVEDSSGVPVGAPPLGDLALMLSDLPKGFEETEAGFETNDPSGEFDYTRSFEATGDYVELAKGKTRLISIENNIIVFESQVEARAFIVAISALMEGSNGEDFLSGLLEDEGLTVKTLSVKQRDVKLGEETKVVEATASTDLGDIVLAFILSRQGRVVSAFIATGEAKGWDIADIGPMAEVVFDRLDAAGVE